MTEGLRHWCYDYYVVDKWYPPIHYDNHIFLDDESISSRQELIVFKGCHYLEFLLCVLLGISLVLDQLGN